jgi:hypothetical protein
LGGGEIRLRLIHGRLVALLARAHAGSELIECSLRAGYVRLRDVDGGACTVEVGCRGAPLQH